MEILQGDVDGRINVIGVIGFALNASVAFTCAGGFLTGAFALASDPLRAEVDHRVYAAVGLSLIILVGLAGWRGMLRAEARGRKLAGRIDLYCVSVGLRGLRVLLSVVGCLVIGLIAFFVSLSERGGRLGLPPFVIGDPATSFWASALYATLMFGAIWVMWHLLAAVEKRALNGLVARANREPAQ